MKYKYLIFLFIIFIMNSCTPPLLLCFLEFSNFEKTYDFKFSKEELKNQIVEAYTYDENLFKKNFAITLIENKKVNSQYNKSVEVRLDKENWDKLKSEIRTNTPDTLALLIRKNRKEINLIAIIDGNSEKSSLTIKNVEYKRRKVCKKETEYYKTKVTDKIEKKLIAKIK